MNSAPYQSTLVRGWNTLSRLGGQEGTISAEALIEAAAQSCPDVDETPVAVHDALSTLVDALNNSAGLHPFGRYYTAQLLKGLLINRRRLMRLWKERPAILVSPLQKPLIILGLPRSGTSFLFNLLANDPAHRHLANWETTVSQIPPRTIPSSMTRDPRRRMGKLLMLFQRYLAPNLEDIHEFHLDGPEECTPILMQGFDTQAIAGMFNIPEYSSWLDHVDHGPTYEHHKRVLQTLQSCYPAQRWLLKSPDHLAGLDAIMHTYPDACLIHLHRDPVQSVSSWASLNAAFRGISSPKINTFELGTQILERLANDMDSYLAVRKRAAPNRFYDLPYQQLISKPLHSVQDIYTYFNLELSVAACERIEAFVNIDREKSRPHRYTPEDFGLSASRIRARFTDYITRFGLQEGGRINND